MHEQIKMPIPLFVHSPKCALGNARFKRSSAKFLLCASLRSAVQGLAIEEPEPVAPMRQPSGYVGAVLNGSESRLLQRIQAHMYQIELCRRMHAVCAAFREHVPIQAVGLLSSPRRTRM